MTQTVGNAVAERENRPLTPYLIVTKEMGPELSAILPTHLASEPWLRITAGALKKGKVEGNGHTELENAVMNNPGAFVQALRQAASLGLQPGSDEFYLTTRKNKNNGNRKEILGIVGYQGYVELMYRAGAVESVVVEVVYSTDKFEYVRGVHKRPIHETDWDSDERGGLRLAYAYANMKGGAVSKVVVLNKHDIAKIKKYAQGADSEYSPWSTNEASMWLKSAARQLRKWVPTSANYITEQLRAAKAADLPTPTVPDLPGQAPVPEHAQVYIHDPDDVVDGQMTTEEAAVPPAAEPAEPPPALPMNRRQQEALGQLFKQGGVTTPLDRLNYARDVLSQPDLMKTGDMTFDQATRVIETLQVDVAKAGGAELDAISAPQEPPMEGEGA